MTTQPDIPKSCANLTAQLVVEGCLPIIEGTVQGKTPIAPVPLTPEERAKLGLKTKGMTLFYPAGEEGVFFDMGGNEFSVWFVGDDFQNATNALHAALMRAFPKAKQLDDVAHPKNSKLRARTYRVEFKNGRLAGIQTSFQQVKAGAQKFTVRVTAQQRPS